MSQEIMRLERLHLILFGNVQGVGLRWLIRRKAQKLALRGWVCNVTDGSVEITAEGERHSLEELIAWCYNKPESIEITRIQERWKEATGEFNGFKIIT